MTYNCDSRILEGKVPFKLWPYFFGAKLISLKNSDGGFRPIAAGNIFLRLSAKCVGYHGFESRQVRYGSRKVGVVTKRGAELAPHVLHCLIETPHPEQNVILKIDFENAFNSINRQFMLEKKTFENTLKFITTHTVGQVFFLYGNSRMKSCERTQQGDPESPILLSEFFHDLTEGLDLKKNIWYLDDGNLGDDYRTFLKDLKDIVETENTLNSKSNPQMANFFLSDITEKRRSKNLSFFQKLCPRIETSKNDEIIILGSPLTRNHKQTFWKRKLMNWKKLMELLEN